MTHVRLLLAVLFAILAPLAARAQTFPAQNGTFVVDAANLLDPSQEAALDAKLAGYQKTTGRQMVVATVPSLEGYPVEDYGYRLARAWQIGDKVRNDGALLLVAPNDRKVRIEVGAGLEGSMTDLYSGVIIRDKMLPLFKAGDYPAGIMAGTDAAITQLQLSPDEAAKRIRQVSAAPRNDGVDVSAVIFWLFIFFFFILPMLRGMFGGKRGRRMGGAPVIIWGPGDWGGGSSGGFSSWGGGDSGGGFSGGGGSFDGGGASGSW